MAQLHVPHREGLNLFGLFVEALLRRRLNEREWEPRGQAQIVLRAGGMTVTLRLAAGAITLLPGAVERATVSVSGDLSTFLHLGLGHSPFWLLLTGRLRARGNLLALWPLRRLLGPPVCLRERKANEP